MVVVGLRHGGINQPLSPRTGSTWTELEMDRPSSRLPVYSHAAHHNGIIGCRWEELQRKWHMPPSGGMLSAVQRVPLR